MQQECHRIPPKIPDGTQERGASGEEQHPAAQNAQEHEQPQLALGAVEGEKEDGAAGQQAVDQIQRPGDPGEPQPEHPEQFPQSGIFIRPFIFYLNFPEK